MENDDKIQSFPIVMKETRNNEKQEQTVIPAKKLNTRKRKRIEPLENQFDSCIRRDKDKECELKILKSQQLILDKLDKLTNLIDNKSSLSNACLLKPTLPGSSVDECIHGEVLQENLKVFVRNMDLSNGLILDEMLQDNALTDNEAQEIRELSGPNKTRMLATILGRTNKSIFKDFLRLIAEKEFYPHIATVLSQSYEKKLKAKDKHPQCVRCFIIKNVNISHVLDHLCENHVISLHDVGYVIKGDSRDVGQFWRNIFKKMEHPILGENYVSVFSDSLKEHYPHIAKRTRSQHNLKCLCASTVLSYPSGSAGNASELSTTSTIIPNSTKQRRKNTYQPLDSISDTSDISTSTVIPGPKPETREWVQKHHSLPEEIVKTEDLSNHHDFKDRMSDVENGSYTKVHATDPVSTAGTIVPKSKKQNQSEDMEQALKIRSLNNLRCFCATTLLSYPNGSAGNAPELSVTSTIIRNSKKQKRQNTYQSGSIENALDISTPSVLPEPKLKTRQRMHKHHSLTEENVKTEDFTKRHDFTDRMNDLANGSYTKMRTSKSNVFKSFNMVKSDMIDIILKRINFMENQIKKTRLKKR